MLAILTRRERSEAILLFESLSLFFFTFFKDVVTHLIRQPLHIPHVTTALTRSLNRLVKPTSTSYQKKMFSKAFLSDQSKTHIQTHQDVDIVRRFIPAPR